ncbi:MAG: YciI family protein [Pseudobdellovibrionaceae bacterium]
MFVIILTYKKPPDIVEAVRGVHRAFLDTLYAQNVLLASGPQIPKTGGILIARGMDQTELEALLQKDPFYTEGIADYQIIAFDPVKHDPALKDVLQK